MISMIGRRKRHHPYVNEADKGGASAPTPLHTSPAYTGRFFRKGASETGFVNLSAAKDLSPSQVQILRCAQVDNLW
jgi:hypothetical protein